MSSLLWQEQRVAANTEFYFWFWSRLILPGGCSGAECGSATPEPSTGNVGGPVARREQGQGPPVPPAPLQACLAHRPCNTRGPAVSQPLTRGLNTSSHCPGGELLPRRSKGRAGGLHNLPPGKDKPKWGFYRLSQVPSDFFSALPSQSAVNVPRDAEFLCWKLEMELKLKCWDWTCSHCWAWCLSGSARDGAVQKWQWGNTTTTNGCCCIASPPPQSLGQISLSFSM